MNQYDLAERAESMVRGYADAPKGAFALAWRAMRLLEKTRDLARAQGVDGLTRGHGIPDSAVSRFACAIVENACRLPAHGGGNVDQALSAAHWMAVKVVRILRRKQVIATAPKASLERLVKLGWLVPPPAPGSEEYNGQEPA